jgi:hypothetical protein
MRYRGGGVGHLATQQCNEVLLADKHTLVTGVQDIDETESVGSSGVRDDESDKGDKGGEDDEGDKGDKDEGDKDDEDDEDSDDEATHDVNNGLLVSATNDVDLITAAGFALL